MAGGFHCEIAASAKPGQGSFPNSRPRERPPASAPNVGRTCLTAFRGATPRIKPCQRLRLEAQTENPLPPTKFRWSPCSSVIGSAAENEARPIVLGRPRRRKAAGRVHASCSSMASLPRCVMRYWTDSTPIGRATTKPPFARRSRVTRAFNSRTLRPRSPAPISCFNTSRSARARAYLDPATNDPAQFIRHSTPPALASLHAATLTPSKGRLILCTVPGSTPNRLAILRTPSVRPGAFRAARIRASSSGAIRGRPSCLPSALARLSPARRSQKPFLQGLFSYTRVRAQSESSCRSYTSVDGQFDGHRSAR